MAPTTIIATKNNERTIARSLDSVIPLGGKIIVIDLGSVDGTISICKRMNVEIIQQNALDRAACVNKAVMNEKRVFYLQPWEVLHSGHALIANAAGNQPVKVQVLHDSIMTWETRVWEPSKHRLQYPVFETIITDDAKTIPALIYAIDTADYESYLPILETWRSASPTNKAALYYHAVTMLALKRYNDFINLSEHFMFMTRNVTQASILNRYYYSLVQIHHFKNIKPAFQNLSLCLAHRPLMAEAWCLLGDAYYHHFNDFKRALLHYENAILLGSKRLNTDTSAMDISKYYDYPTTMMNSCKDILDNHAEYVANIS